MFYQSEARLAPINELEPINNLQKKHDFSGQYRATPHLDGDGSFLACGKMPRLSVQAPDEGHRVSLLVPLPERGFCAGSDAAGMTAVASERLEIFCNLLAELFLPFWMCDYNWFSIDYS